jgi:hypothetical protein
MFEDFAAHMTLEYKCISLIASLTKTIKLSCTFSAKPIQMTALAAASKVDRGS